VAAHQQRHDDRRAQTDGLDQREVLVVDRGVDEELVGDVREERRLASAADLDGPTRGGRVGG
jgi:hypothetical protein